MKKIIISIMFLFLGGNITNAQIKVVGDGYKDSLSGAKSYYDMDVDFDSLFPHISPLEHRHKMGPQLSQNLYENMVGDTVYIPDGIQTKYYISKSTDAGQSFFEQNMIPEGYYVIQGYVFCKENLERMGLGDRGESIHDLKEELLRNEVDIRGYLERVLLRPVDDKDIIYSFNPSIWNNGDLVFCLRFYNELSKHFVGKRVQMYKYNERYFDNYLKVLSSGTIIKDDIRGESLKILDDVFVVDDVIYNNGKFFLILNGEKTGSFAKTIDLIKSSYKFYPPNDLKFVSSDILCARVPFPGDGGDYDGTFIMVVSDYNLLQKKYAELKTKNIREQQLQEQQRKQKQEKEKAEFRNRMIAKYGDGNGTLVGNRQIAIGMTKEMCKYAWGTPINTYRTTTSYGQSEVWCYNYKTRVYFYDGKVVQIDD